MYKNQKNSILVFVITFSIFSLVNVYHYLDYEESKKLSPNLTALAIEHGDEPHYLSMTSNLVRHHSVYMEDFFRDKNPDTNLIFPNVYFTDSHTWEARQYENGHFISINGYGLPYLLIPSYYLGAIFGATTMISIISSFTSVFIYKFSSKLTTNKIGLVTTFLYSFSTFLFIYSNAIYSDVVIALFLLSSLYFIVTKNHSNLYLALSGAILGYGIFLKISFVLVDIVLIPMVVILFIKKSINLKSFSFFCFMFIVFTLLALLNNSIIYGNLIGGKYTESAIATNYDNTNVEFNLKLQDQYSLDALIEIFFGQYHGLFIYSPIIMLFFLGFGPLWNKNKRLFVTISALSLSTIIGYVIINPLGSVWGGDPPFRYIFPIVPLTAIPFALGFQRFYKILLYRILFFVLLLISTSLSIIFSFNRITSLDHLVIKFDLLHKIYWGFESIFPSLGPETVGNSHLPHHPMDLYNVVFLSVMIVAICVGIIIGFKKRELQIR